MKESVVQVIRDFLLPRVQKDNSILLGFSGGVDSSALFSLLQECLRFLPPLFLHVAHFDHGWRQESEEEARELKEKVLSLGFHFHGGRSALGGGEGGNQEARAREERYDFFRRVYQHINAQALILAHQKEDQVETVLKRLFEGAGLSSLAGMQEVSEYQHMILWRPLLRVSRKELIEWNRKKKLQPFQDSTNKDLRFLRPRMREKLFPEIERWFGKNIFDNLSFLGEEFALLGEFLQKRAENIYQEKVKEGVLGKYLPIRDGCSSLERRELIRLFLTMQGILPSRRGVLSIDSLLQSKALSRCVALTGRSVLVDREVLFYFSSLPALLIEKYPLKEGRFSAGPFWQWEVVKECEIAYQESSLLEAFWRGRLSYLIPKGSDGTICTYQLLEKSDKKKVSEFFAKKQIPHLFRNLIPLIIVNDSIFFPFSNDCFVSSKCFDVFVIMLKK